MSTHTYNNKNTPGGRRRVVTSKSREQDEQKIKDGIVPPNRSNYNEERRQSIAKLRVAERLAEEQQSSIPINTPEEYEELVESFKEQE